jgi:uncharacterized SAM-binding protein YcdF (DUF218 family)
MPKHDAVLVPGGGVREGGELPSWVRARLDLAVQRYEGAYIIALSAGTTHRPPPVDGDGFPIFESVAAARYLVSAGVPADRILVETCSYDTVGNAFFSRVIHADPLGLRRLLVITSDFHVARAQAVFEWVYGLTPQAAAYEMDFAGVADPAMDTAILRERQKRERASLEALAALTPNIRSMRDFHRWLFTEHSAYRSTARSFAGDALASY